MMDAADKSPLIGAAAYRLAAASRGPVASAESFDDEALELQRLQREELAARTEYLRQRQRAGQYAHPVSVFRHVTGPDGRGYLREVELQFDLIAAPTADPEETIAKAHAVKQAALAGDFPDRHDLMVAAKASLMMALARSRQVSAAEAETHAGAASQRAVDYPAANPIESQLSLSA